MFTIFILIFNVCLKALFVCGEYICLFQGVVLAVHNVSPAVVFKLVDACLPFCATTKLHPSTLTVLW